MGEKAFYKNIIRIGSQRPATNPHVLTIQQKIIHEIITGEIEHNHFSNDSHAINPIHKFQRVNESGLISTRFS